MITITIGPTSRTMRSFTPQWLREQIESRREDGKNAIVRVEIDNDCANMVLETPGNPSSGRTRPPNLTERQIFDLWDKFGLNRIDYSIGRLVAFLNQVKSWC